MIETHHIELFREEGDPFRSVRLAVNADGSVRLDAHDMGRRSIKYGAMTIMNSGSTSLPRQFINFFSSCSATSTPVKATQSMSFEPSAGVKRSNTNGTAGSSPVTARLRPHQPIAPHEGSYPCGYELIASDDSHHRLRIPCAAIHGRHVTYVHSGSYFVR
jgi:hypothetical protein